jgi:hypothetical protein
MMGNELLKPFEAPTNVPYGYVEEDLLCTCACTLLRSILYDTALEAVYVPYCHDGRQACF